MPVRIVLNSPGWGTWFGGSEHGSWRVVFTICYTIVDCANIHVGD